MTSSGKWLRASFFWLLIALAIVLVFVIFFRPQSDTTTVVVGASRGLGRGIATAFAETGAPVVAVARGADALAALTGGGSIKAEVADAADPSVAGRLLDRHDPRVLVLVAGASPLTRPLQHQTWETFSVNWETDVRVAFHWLREALLKPLRPGSRVVVISSGAAVAGSPLTGGYAGAKATQRFITAYAQEEADRAGLDITFTAVLPRITPSIGLEPHSAGLPLANYLESLRRVRSR